MKAMQFYEQAGVAMTCRSFQEYEMMFALDRSLLGKGPILDVAAGASSFTAEANEWGYKAAAADPLYEKTPDNIEKHGLEEIGTSTRKLLKLTDAYIWDYYGSLEALRANREKSLKLFVADYKKQQSGGRYNISMLPSLDFADESFSLVLCSHFLFLYHEQFDYSFHENAVKELLRVCRKNGEVRIYPLVTLKWEPYPFINQLMEQCAALGMKAELLKSSLSFIPGSTDFLRIHKSK